MKNDIKMVTETIEKLMSHKVWDSRSALFQEIKQELPGTGHDVFCEVLKNEVFETVSRLLN